MKTKDDLHFTVFTLLWFILCTLYTGAYLGRSHRGADPGAQICWSLEPQDLYSLLLYSLHSIKQRT